MKKTVKLLSITAAIACLMSSVTACNKSGLKQGDNKTVQIYAWSSGLGLEWLQSIVDDFNAGQSEYTAELDKTTSVQSIISTLKLGSSNPYDLYFTALNSYQYYDDFIEFTDLLDSNPTGENVKIRDKYYPEFVDSLKDSDGKEKVLTYGNCWTGIIYNVNMLPENKVPRTTDELEMLVTELAGNKKTPWLFYNENGGLNGYWNYVSYAWAAQYDGIEKYNNELMQLKNETETAPSKTVFTRKDGRYEALKVMEKILTPENTHKQCTNTNYTTVQGLFLDGSATMSVNGSWVLYETGRNTNVNMMKTPVISSIVDTLEDTEMDDETLSQIILEIDNGATLSENCSQNDFDRIKSARNTMYNNSTEQYIFTPKYSNCIDGVKEFLRWYHKDSSVVKYCETLKLPSNIKLNDASLFNTSNLSTWSKTMFKFAEEQIPVMTRMDRANLFVDYYINVYAGVSTAQKLIASNPKDRLNADQIWKSFEDKVNENWADWTK